MNAIKKTAIARNARGKKNLGGRPPKYREARRPITVTLPERILRDLESVNRDRSRAIVKCVEAAMRKGKQPAKPVELIELTPGKALIVVGPCALLRQLEWLRLVEISPFRFLLVLPTGTAVEILEVAINDLLQNLEADNPERILLTELREIIAHQRRGRGITKAELLFVDMPLGTDRPGS